jgi:F-type H+-transporting ATPase subunit delta
LSAHSTDALQIARRYATALFSLAVEAKKEASVVNDMQVLSVAMTVNADLAQVIANPIVSNSKKADILAALMAKADGITQRAVVAIAHGGRASVIPMIADDLAARLAAHRGEIEATVTSARALSAATQQQLAQALADATGKTVKLKLSEDVAVLGGLRIEFGSLRFDATLAGALNAMREQLLVSTH